MKAIYRIWYICECGESYYAQMPAMQAWLKPSLFRAMLASHDLDVIVHRSQHTNERIESWINSAKKS